MHTLPKLWCVVQFPFLSMCIQYIETFVIGDSWGTMMASVWFLQRNNANMARDFSKSHVFNVSCTMFLGNSSLRSDLSVGACAYVSVVSSFIAITVIVSAWTLPQNWRWGHLSQSKQLPRTTKVHRKEEMSHALYPIMFAIGVNG